MDQVKVEDISSDESHTGEKRKSPQCVKNESTPKKTKATRSDVWYDFEKFTDKEGNKKGRCKHCSKALAADPYKNGTSSMKNHTKSCSKRPGKLTDQRDLRSMFNVQEDPSDDEKIDPTLVPNKSSSDEEYVHQHPDLTKLKPPSRSDGFETGELHLEVLKAGSLVLVSNINEAEDANKMIDLSSKTFEYFDSLGVDYTPLYKVVCSVIHHQCDKEALAKQKPYPAFVTKAVHDLAASEVSKAEDRCAAVNRELEDAQHESDAIAAHLTHLYDQVKKVKEEKAKLEAKVGAAQAEKVSCGEVCSKAKSELQKLAPEMSEAQEAIDEYERRWKEVVDELERAKEELSSLRASLQ